VKTVVITGSTRGIGFGLADAFLKLGCNVIISGRTQKAVDEAVNTLTKNENSKKILGLTCDVHDWQQVQMLWDAAVKQFEQVDIWINNAGVAASDTPAWEYSPDQIDSVVDTNIKGTMNGACIAVKGMLAQGHGAIYSLEGLGSDNGRHVKGQTIYGMSKAALRYFDDSLALELKGFPVISGAILPGMVLTDMVMSDYRKDPKRLEKIKFIFNIIANLPEDVTPVLAKKVLANTKHGARIHFSSTATLFGRFLLAPFRKRDIVSEAMKR
jgi:NAD(P)-dependent dehydrogenase (short-subunit alcohol dehydrogenase family)